MEQGIKGIDVDLVFCLPGSPSSAEQAISVQMTMLNLMHKGKLIGLKSTKSCNIYVARNGCLAEVHNGHRKDQKPFEGTYKSYDRIVWVDSDNLISADVVQKLIDYDVDIVAAWYRQYSKGDLGPENKAVCGKWDFSNGGNIVDAYKVKDMPLLGRDEKGLVEVDWAGMGCMVIKKGVFEALEYPWFRSWVMEWKDENGILCSDIWTDDAGFCYCAKEAGFKIYVDPSLQILHQKLVDI